MTKQLFKALILLSCFYSLSHPMEADESQFSETMGFKFDIICKHESCFRVACDENLAWLNYFIDESQDIISNSAQQIKELVINNINLIDVTKRKLPSLMVIHQADIMNNSSSMEWKHNQLYIKRKQLIGQESIQLEQFQSELESIMLGTEAELKKLSYLFPNLHKNSFIKLSIQFRLNDSTPESQDTCSCSLIDTFKYYLNPSNIYSWWHHQDDGLEAHSTFSCWCNLGC